MNPRTIFHFLLLCFFLTIIYVKPGYSQIQVTQQEFQKLIGENTSHHYTEWIEGNINIGKTEGPNVYDFSSVNLEALPVSNCYLVSTIPILAARYPASATVFGESPTTIEKNPVFYISDDSVFIAGDASLVPNYEFRHYRPFELVSIFPLTYGTSFNWSVVSYDTTYNSMWQVVETNSDSSLEVTTVDGYGTMKLSIGNFECLRIRKHYSQNDGGNKEYLYLTREGILIIVGGVEHSAPDTGIVSAGLQVLIPSPLVDIKNEIPNIVTSYGLEQNYPNPFNPNTTIIFNLPEEDFVTLTIYNSLGEEKVQLISNTMPSGRHEVEFNALDYTSGIYFYRLQAGSFTETKKMMIMK